MKKATRPTVVLILRLAEEYKMCIQVVLKQGIQKCSVYRIQPILLDARQETIRHLRDDIPRHDNNSRVNKSEDVCKISEDITICRQQKATKKKQMFITIARMNHNGNVSGISSIDTRGKTPPSNNCTPEKLQEVKDHISAFPLYKSHYTCRESSRTYLPPYLNLQVMYDLYCEGKEKPVSRGIYEREFHKVNISFKKPKVDTCHRYDVLQAKAKFTAMNNTAREDIDEELAVHHMEADKACLAKDKGKILALSDNSWMCSLTCFKWHEAESARGGTRIATCVLKELVSLPLEVNQVSLYSDTCGGQNKYSHAVSMFLFAMQENQPLNIVDHNVLVSGHSHMECDGDHGMIEKQKKTRKCKYQWHIRMTGISWYALLVCFKDTFQLRKKDTEGNQINWHNVRWFHFTKD
ncbi:hypothetical protein PR048_025143 [Dryococelus australis]|uniref:Uncharacterized protein n=1 Tax=Dryococelus australis TaxID=614101 RepID=A0ABQ9GQK8_9NEOP|nr:hypothetical protein PR048_025143 [Dryococelus australis]